jgi:hypothetical protein
MELRELTAEVLRLKQQVAQLEEALRELRQGQRPDASVLPSAASQLVRRNAERLADEVRRRQSISPEPNDDTDIDLLIDRLHDLALENEGP